MEDESRVLSLLLVDGDYINRDYRLHCEHRNVSRGGFGSYGDGRIRERKMYIFPNPLTDGDLVGTASLITQIEGLEVEYPSLAYVMPKVRCTPTGKEYTFHVYRLRE